MDATVSINNLNESGRIIMLCYKIVNQYYESPYVNRCRKHFFSLDITTFPTVGRIFVFPTLRDALLYMGDDASSMGHKLLLCECDTLVKHTRINNIERYELYEEYWKDPDNKGYALLKVERIFSTNWIKPIRELNITWFCEYLDKHEVTIDGVDYTFTNVHYKR